MVYACRHVAIANVAIEYALHEIISAYYSYEVETWLDNEVGQRVSHVSVARTSAVKVNGIYFKIRGNLSPW